MYRQPRNKLTALATAIALLAMALSLGLACDGESRSTPPFSAFTAEPTSGTAPLEVQFINQSRGEITDWAWDFDSDGTVDSTEPSPSHTYDTPGIYTVSLKVAGPGGSDTEAKTDHIEVTSPFLEADFSADSTSGPAPLEVQFTDQSTGEITDWEWDFDSDGTVDSTEPSPSHTYDTPGIYTVSLKVAGPGGSDTEAKTDHIEVTSPFLEADFSADSTSGPAPLEVQFTDQSTGEITDWEWDFDNDGIVDSTEQSPSFTYETRGSYTISLTIDGMGGTDKKKKADYVVVSPVPWTFDPAWWEERHVWYFGQPLGSELEYYYDVIDQTGVSAVSWIDIRFLEGWEARVGQIVDKLHSRGIPVVGTLSMITVWQEQGEEPPELTEAILRDPFGNLVEDTMLTDVSWPVHSTLHPAWRDYLLSAPSRGPSTLA